MPTRPQIIGVDRTIRAWKKMKSHDGRNLAAGIQSCLQVIYRKSQTYVPKDTLALMHSGEVLFVPGVGLNAAGMVAYGGNAAPHAFVVHERAGVFHAPPTRAFYLTAAINDTRGTCVSILRRQMRVT